MKNLTLILVAFIAFSSTKVLAQSCDSMGDRNCRNSQPQKKEEAAKDCSRDHVDYYRDKEGNLVGTYITCLDGTHVAKDENGREVSAEDLRRAVRDAHANDASNPDAKIE